MQANNQMPHLKTQMSVTRNAPYVVPSFDPSKTKYFKYFIKLFYLCLCPAALDLGSRVFGLVHIPLNHVFRWMNKEQKNSWKKRKKNQEMPFIFYPSQSFASPPSGNLLEMV